MVPLFLVGAVVLQAWAWRRLARRVRAGRLTRLGSATRYAGWAFVPVAALVAVFFLMMGVEEWRGVALVPERGALLMIPLLALALVGSAVYALRAVFLSGPAGADRGR